MSLVTNQFGCKPEVLSSAPVCALFFHESLSNDSLSRIGGAVAVCVCLPPFTGFFNHEFGVEGWTFGKPNRFWRRSPPADHRPKLIHSNASNRSMTEWHTSYLFIEINRQVTSHHEFIRRFFLLLILSSSSTSVSSSICSWNSLSQQWLAWIGIRPRCVHTFTGRFRLQRRTGGRNLWPEQVEFDWRSRLWVYLSVQMGRRTKISTSPIVFKCSHLSLHDKHD